MAITELTEKLNAQPLIDGLLAQLTAPLASLNATTPPASSDELSAHPGAQVSVDVEGFGAATLSISALVPDVIAAVPTPDTVLRPLLTAIELVEKVTTTDIEGDLRGLLDRLSRDLKPGPGGDFLQLLGRLSGELRGARELSALIELLSSVFRASGLDLQPAQVLAGVLPAASDGVRAFGALMSLETMLAEGERLARITASQLDRPNLELELAALRNDFAQAARWLSALTSGPEIPSPAELDAAVRGVAACNARLAAVEALLARGLGFGEATLVHLNLPALSARTSELALGLGRVDLDALGRAVQSLSDRLASLVALDLGTPPVPSLDALLTLLEDKSRGVASAIDAVDITPLTAPIERGLGAVTGVLGDTASIVTQITTTLRSALEAVKQAIRALPFDQIVNAVDTLLAPVRQAMTAIAELVAGIEAALQTAIGAVTDALTTVEGAIDAFKAEVESLLKAAADFVEGLHLDQVVGAVADKVNAFADELGRVQMAPYFDTANQVIGTAADVVEALPLSLLPDSVKAELDQAAAPVRAIDLPALETEVLGWFEIRDGKFALRAPLEDSLSELQDKYDALMTELSAADPRGLVEPLNAELANIRARVDEVFPALDLGPIRDAITRVKDALAELDLREQLKPVDDAFATVLALVDQYSPVALIVPIEQRVDEARAKLTGAIKLDEWEPSLVRLSDAAKGLVGQLDPALLEPLVRAGFGEGQRLAGQLESIQLGQAFGDLIAAMLAGSGQLIDPRAFGTVLGFFSASGKDALNGRAARVQAAIESTRAGVAGLDLPALSRDLSVQLTLLRSAAERLPADNPARERLLATIERSTLGIRFDSLSANRVRYLALIDAAQGHAADLARVGLSQVDVTIDGLRTAFAGFNPLKAFFSRLLAQIGIHGLENGIAGVLQRVLATFTPERALAIFAPIFGAVRGRINALIDLVVDPLRDGITQLRALVAELDLTPLREGLEQIVAEAKTQIEALSPSKLLEPTLVAFDAFKAELAAFDPLAPIEQVLELLRTTIARVLGKLDAGELLAQPIRIYDEIMKALRALDLQSLLAPVLDTLDDLAGQIDGGLDSTVTALQRLQAALPAPGSGGGGSASVSGSIG